MSWRNVKLIFFREVMDQLRDRRTLFMVAVLPILLYPLLGFGVLHMAAMFTEQPRTVVVLGADNLPDLPLLDGDKFVKSWFRISTQADKLRVISDSTARPIPPPVTDATATPIAVPVPDPAIAKENAKLLEQAQSLREPVRQRADVEKKLDAAREAKLPDEKIMQLETQLQRLNETLGHAFHKSEIQVLIIIPDSFKQNLTQLRDDLAKHDGNDSSLTKFNYPRPLIVQNSADDKSVVAANRVHDALREWERALLRNYLKETGLPEQLPTPVNPTPVDLAAPKQLSAHVWSKMFPALLVIMALTGAFYPAVDLGAGEKERGTMETLLICPATRAEIVVGKFLTVMLFSASTALLNLASMGFTSRYTSSLGGDGGLSRLGDMTLPPVSSLIWVLIVLVPLASLFSALCLAFATFARSSKEGQYYLTPLLMVTMGVTVFCASPGIEIEPFYSVIPVMGPALLLKGLLKASGPDITIYLYAVPVLLTSFAYSFLALWWAIDQFGREEVLFREAERFDIRLWVKHLLRDKEPTPSFTEAGFCFLLLLLLQFLSLKSMQGALRGSAPEEQGVLQAKLLLIQQLALIATPALMMGVMLTTSLRKTFSIRWPGIGRLAWATLLPFALLPLNMELQKSLDWFFPKLPTGIAEALKPLSDPSMPLWLVLLAFAVAPAICEEIAFRGFMLSGFRRSGRVGLAIVLSSLAFGVIHMIPQQVFSASLMGIILALICVRSRSLLPGIAFHVVNNSLAILSGRLGPSLPNEGIWSWMFHYQDGTLRFHPAFLCVAALAAIALLHRLTRHPKIQDPDDPAPADDGTTQNAWGNKDTEPRVSVRVPV